MEGTEEVLAGGVGNCSNEGSTVAEGSSENVEIAVDSSNDRLRVCIP